MNSEECFIKPSFVKNRTPRNNQNRVRFSDRANIHESQDEEEDNIPSSIRSGGNNMSEPKVKLNKDKSFMDSFKENKILIIILAIVVLLIIVIVLWMVMKN